MPSRYWGALFAVIGLAITSFGLGAMVVALNNTNEERYQSYRYAADKPQAIDPALTRPAEAQSFKYRTPCSEPQGHDESDLCAQWRAAKAAENSALWAKWGFWIAVVGSAFLLWQIALTRKAVEDTSEATEAMRRSNEIAEQDRRPWISVSIAAVQIVPAVAGFNIHCRVRFRNTGRSVASQIITNAKICIGWAGDETTMIDSLFESWRREKPRHPTALIPDDFRDVRCAMLVKDQFADWPESGLVGCVVVVHVRYFTPEGLECLTEQSFTIGHKGGHTLVRDGLLIKSEVKIANAELVTNSFRSGQMT